MNNIFDKISPVNELVCENASVERIRGKVLMKIHGSVGKKTRPLRILLTVAAVIGISGAGFLTVNAATGGMLLEKIYRAVPVVQNGERKVYDVSYEPPKESGESGSYKVTGNYLYLTIDEEMLNEEYTIDDAISDYFIREAEMEKKHREINEQLGRMAGKWNQLISVQVNETAYDVALVYECNSQTRETEYYRVLFPEFNEMMVVDADDITDENDVWYIRDLATEYITTRLNAGVDSEEYNMVAKSGRYLIIQDAFR